MNTTRDLRTSKRLPIVNRVQVLSKGKMISYALAINISMGGVFLIAEPTLPVGSPCRLAILPSGHQNESRIVLEGTVVRNDSTGTAIQFSNALEKNTYESFTQQKPIGIGNSILNSYLAYFRVSQNKNHEGAQQLLGVDPRTFRRVFLTTFCTCIPVAVLPVWAMRDAIYPLAPAWLKVTAAFGYAAVWFGVIQPTVDLSILHFLKHKNTAV